MHSIAHHIDEVKGKRVLLRLDFNVPLARQPSLLAEQGELFIVDDFRITQSLATINLLRSHGAKVIILAHIESEETDSLELIAKHLSQLLSSEVSLVKNYAGDPESQGMKAALLGVKAMQEGDVVLFENLRLYQGEKNDDPVFAKALAAYGDIYVNDAFSVSHRPHASVVGVPALLPHFAGPLFMEEVSHISKAFSPSHPFLFMLGGAKFDTKLGLVQKFLNVADFVFVGGALGNDVLKAKGFPVGKSIVSSGVDLSAIVSNPKLIAPIDVAVAPVGNPVHSVLSVKQPQNVVAEDMILDAGPATTDILLQKVTAAKYIVWNGPFGKYQDGFNDPTIALGHAIAEKSAKGECESLIGGGDTLAAVDKDDLKKFSFVSTGGGAMLEFLANETLPGIGALE